jgi:hypothetical protein
MKTIIQIDIHILYQILFKLKHEKSSFIHDVNEFLMKKSVYLTIPILDGKKTFFFFFSLVGSFTLSRLSDLRCPKGQK